MSAAAWTDVGRRVDRCRPPHAAGGGRRRYDASSDVARPSPTGQPTRG